MALTVKAVENAKPLDKAYKLSDSGGLYLLVHPNGSKYWRYKYRFAGKENTASIGLFPDISLALARAGRDQAKKLLAQNTNPNEVKKTQKLQAIELANNTFEIVAREWHLKQSVKWVPKHAARTLSLLERSIFPYIGKTPFPQISAASLLDAVQRIEKRGNHETAHRAMQICGQVSRYAIATARAQVDLSVVLKGALTPVKEKHHASITNPEAIGRLLNAICSYSLLDIGLSDSRI